MVAIIVITAGIVIIATESLGPSASGRHASLPAPRTVPTGQRSERPSVPPPDTVTLAGAGDIGSCGSSGAEATAALLDKIEGAVFTTGDNAYPDGAIADFAACYAPSWGRHLSRTLPAPGNHDYHTDGAWGYLEYFGASAANGYYAVDLGRWRIYSLNSERVDEQQLSWLTADLAANPRDCVLAFWHRPRFSSGRHGNDESVAPLWSTLYEAGAEVVVSGHDHDYERFGPMDGAGQAADAGMRQFVVGTGGSHLRDFEQTQANSEIRWNGGYGIVKFELRTSDYSWEFIPADGSVKVDSGTGPC